MSEKLVKTPSADHPIGITRNPKRVVVTLGGKVLADTTEALTLREAAYPAVQYIPRKDVDMSSLERSLTSTYCPYKGDAAYFSIRLRETLVGDAIWTYEEAFTAVKEIENHLAFYPDRVDSIEEYAIS